MFKDNDSHQVILNFRDEYLFILSFLIFDTMRTFEIQNNRL